MSQSQKPEIGQMEVRKITARDYEFSYVDIGSGEALVLIHGSALDFRYWNETISILSAKYRCIAMSRRFHWPVPLGAPEVPYKALDQADDVIAFIDLLGLGPVHLVGHSYGGYLATRVASLRPDLVRTLVLMEPGGSVEGQESVRSLAPLQKSAMAMLQNGRTRAGVAAYLDSVCGSPKWEERSPEFRSISLANYTSLILQMQDKTRPPMSVELLSAIVAPTLVLVGALSQSPFPDVARRIADLIENATYIEVPSAAHLINIDNFEMFLELVTTFIGRRLVAAK